MNQLELKYGNCIGHYRAVEMVQGDVLKVRMVRGFRNDMWCVDCADLLLTQHKKECHDKGTAGWWSKEGGGEQGMINKHSWIDLSRGHILQKQGATKAISVSALENCYS